MSVSKEWLYILMLTLSKLEITTYYFSFLCNLHLSIKVCAKEQLSYKSLVIFYPSSGKVTG